MQLSDYHVHSSFSTDSTTPPEEVVKAAINEQITNLCFTDHMDLMYPEDESLFVFDTNRYFNTMVNLQEKYKSEINLFIGMELGLRNEPDVFSAIKEKCDALSKEPFDFIIGSTHIYDYADPYYKKFWEGKDAFTRILEYYEATLFNVTNYDCYDVYGHLDYVIRYMPESHHYEQSQYMELIEAILKTIISKGKGIEINTSSLNKGFNAPNPNPSIIKLYKELGGKIITLGSDAHSPENLCTHFDTAIDILKAAGFDSHTIFKKRKPQYIPLD